jgi:hypothetical protein
MPLTPPMRRYTIRLTLCLIVGVAAIVARWRA